MTHNIGVVTDVGDTLPETCYDQPVTGGAETKVDISPFLREMGNVELILKLYNGADFGYSKDQGKAPFNIQGAMKMKFRGRGNPNRFIYITPSVSTRLQILKTVL